jgi:hypothetical protein
MCQSVGPKPTQLTRRAGKRDCDSAVVLDEDGRRRAGEPERDAAFGERCLFADPGKEVPERPLQPLRDTA